MATYPAGTHTVGPGQLPYPDGSMPPFPPGDIQQLATRVNTISGSGIGYCATTAARDALVTNGDAFTGFACYCADTGLMWQWNGSAWNPFAQQNVQFHGFTVDSPGGSTMGASATLNSTAQTVTVPTGAQASFHMRSSAYMYLAANSAFAGYFYTLIDGGISYGGTPAWRYHNHARGGALVFTADWDFPISAGTHTFQVQLKEDTGSAGHEVWDFQTSLILKW